MLLLWPLDPIPDCGLSNSLNPDSQYYHQDLTNSFSSTKYLILELNECVTCTSEPVMLMATSLVSRVTLLAMTTVRKVPAVYPCCLLGKHLERSNMNIIQQDTTGWNFLHYKQQTSCRIALFLCGLSVSAVDPDPIFWIARIQILDFSFLPKRIACKVF